jgi:hypothetical protein
VDLSFIVRPDFDPEEHVYRVDGIERPGVTEILKAAGLSDNATGANGWSIDPDVLDNAADRGKVAHLAVELDCQKILDEDSLDDEIWPYVDAWRQFVDDTGFVPIANELLFYNPVDDYCGQIDIPGYIGEDLTIIDLKTGSIGLKPWHKYQLAGYARPFYLKEGTWPKRMMLHLRPELKRKKYRDYNFSPESAQWDWKVFAAAHTIWAAKKVATKQS